jgi:hypothetical protein
MADEIQFLGIDQLPIGVGRAVFTFGTGGHCNIEAVKTLLPDPSKQLDVRGNERNPARCIIAKYCRRVCPPADQLLLMHTAQ